MTGELRCIDYFREMEPGQWLMQIAGCEWRAGAFLAELLRKGNFHETLGDGTLYLLDGLTGETINTLTVNGTIEGSPAVFYNTLVIGTTGKNTSYIYGIKLN